MKLKDIQTSPMGEAFTKTNPKLYSTKYNPEEEKTNETQEELDENDNSAHFSILQRGYLKLIPIIKEIHRRVV